MKEYEEHPSKVGAFRDGAFVVLPDAEIEDCTVWFGAEEHSGGMVRWEGLLARRLDADRARVCAVPFWLYGLNLGDEVTVMESAEGTLVATGVARRADSVTFRVVFEGAGDDDGRVRTLMVALEPWECWFDVRSPGFVALSAPASAAWAVARHLEDRARSGELSFEAARSRS